MFDWIDKRFNALLVGFALGSIVGILVLSSIHSRKDHNKCVELCKPFAVLGCSKETAICATSDPWTANIVPFEGDQGQQERCRGCFE